MAFNPEMIQREPKRKAPIVLIYAANGVGKSSFLQSVPDIMVADIEGKLNATSIMRFKPECYDDVKEWLRWCIDQEDPEFGAIGIDSIDWLEALIHKHICQEVGASSISDPHTKATGFGNGYILAANIMKNDLIPLLEDLRDKHNVPIIMVCHAQITTRRDPDIEPYDVHELKLHDKMRTVISERVEAKMYGKLYSNVDQNGKLVPTTERIFVATPQKGIEAKNNLFLPDTFKVSYSNGWQDFLGVLDTNKPTN